MSGAPSHVSSTSESQQHHVLAQQSRYQYLSQSSFLRDHNSFGNAATNTNDGWVMPYSQWQRLGENRRTVLGYRWSHDGSWDSSGLPFEEARLIKQAEAGAFRLDAVDISEGISPYDQAVLQSEQQIQPVDELSLELDRNNPVRLQDDIETPYTSGQYSADGNVQPAVYASFPTYPSCSGTTYLNQHQAWQSSSSTNQAPALINTAMTSSTTSEVIPTSVKLQWPAEDSCATPTSDQLLSTITGSKRKRGSPEPPSKRSRVVEPKKPLSEFVVVFENSPGALSAVKHRRKLDAPVRKAARDVRKAGACHQCRFRKRTCSTGSPCISCLKNGNGLHEVKCQRESPFVGKLMHQYFASSSTKRVLCFQIRLSVGSGSKSEREKITIDGVGGISHPFQLYAERRPLSSLSQADQDSIKHTLIAKINMPMSDNADVFLVEDNRGFGQEVEQWALEYTSKFVNAAGPEFHSTTIGQILGTEYVKKNLPESELVGVMLRVASLAFVLRAGVKCSRSDINFQEFRTVQATVDTILYERLQMAEKELFQMLQRLIFRTAGCLTRGQIFPVALVLWQLMRFLTVSSSHLSNIAQKFRPQAHSQADYQFIGLRLLLSTHMALFRSSNPLLLDMNDKSNRDLIGDDHELAELSAKMRNVVLNFREKGAPEMKGSITYRKENFELFRKVYKGL